MDEPTEDEKQPLMFDEKLDTLFRNAGHQALLTVPELRSVIVVYDYFRELNDVPDISKGVWLSAEGDAERPLDAVMGSFGVMLQGTAQILDSLFQRHAILQAELTRVSQELLDKYQKLARVKSGQETPDESSN